MGNKCLAAIAPSARGPEVGIDLNSGHNSLCNNQLEPPGIGDERALSESDYRQIGQLHGMPGIGSVNTDASTWRNKYDGTLQAMGNSPANQIIGGFGTDCVLAEGMPPAT